MRLALAQLSCADGDTAGNLEKARLAIAEAARRGATLVVLPELHITGFLEAEALRLAAEPWPSPSLAGLIALAAEHGMGLSTSFAEAGEHGRVHNTAVLAGPDGRIVSSYRKTHLFDSERPIYAAGSALADPVDLCGVIMGLLICYDVEFPETARRLGLEGAQCLVVPSANMDPWGPRHRVFVTARALENHLYVAYCNRCGTSTTMSFPGESAIVDPMGRIVCEAGANEEVLCGDIDLNMVAESGHTFDYRRDRRPDVYGALGATTPWPGADGREG